MAPDGNKTGKTGDNDRDERWRKADFSCSPAATPEAMALEAREAADFLKALGHEGRLMMLYHLCERDRTVTELEQLIMSRQAAVSQQLARLRHEKLVSTRRDGNQIIYSLADDRVREMVATIQRLFRKP
ncbi:winged helix-turn-helix transcriptional regulator [Rhodobacter sp. NTK016B]|uniref:ArsR/SmtB family transcription factor n=1 Tax=Rhodobacter sp. NTK016B TaxID=2759676 RepID=UPI001A8C4F5D|nr:winged helix-turn-helix transcriptional regulator [Rhodobacter sp. NTK016B]